jgi:hypothetical protein
MGAFDSRFNDKTYEGDEPIEFSALPSGVSAAIPERLFHRAQQIARAYELHLLPTIDIYCRTVLVKDQCRVLLEELELIISVVRDALLESNITRVKNVVEQCTRHPADSSLVIEGP